MLPDPFERIVFRSKLVQIGAFRCAPDHPCFHDSGPAQNHCFVFPRTAVEIQHEHEAAFVANPNVGTFYNAGQLYRRQAISPEGDRCDWFGVDPGVVRDAVRQFDPAVDEHAEYPFRFTRGWTGAGLTCCSAACSTGWNTSRAQNSWESKRPCSSCWIKFFVLLTRCDPRSLLGLRPDSAMRSTTWK